MPTKETRRQLLAAVQACDDKKGEDTRILELDPADSGLADFFLITSASNDRQAVAIADEIEFRLKQDFGIYAASVEGRRQAEWILLDYVDIVIHVFLTEKRAFYDIERLRKSARNLTAADLESDLRLALVEKTRAVRSRTPAAKAPARTARVLPGKSLVPRARTSAPRPLKTLIKGDSNVTAKPAKGAATKVAKAVPAKPLQAKSAAASKIAPKTAAEPLGALAPVLSNTDQGAKPPILRCEDPDQPVSVALAAAAAAPAAAKKAAKKPAPKTRK